MTSSTISHLSENIQVLRKMFRTIDFYIEYIQKINKTITSSSVALDLNDKEQAKKIYELSCMQSEKNKDCIAYDKFMDYMKAELDIDSIGDLISCTEDMLADRWLVTGQYNLMRSDLMAISWKFDRARNLYESERKNTKNQESVFSEADSQNNSVSHWNSVVIVTSENCYVKDSSGCDHVIKCTTKDGGEVINVKDEIWDGFKSVVKIFDPTDELLNLFRDNRQKRRVLLHFNVLNKGPTGDLKKILPSVKSKDEDNLAEVVEKIFTLQKMWICNKRRKVMNANPSSYQCLKTIIILQSLLPLINDDGIFKTNEQYNKELLDIERYVSGYITKNREEYNKQLVKRGIDADESIMKKYDKYFPISGFGDFAVLKYPQRLEDAMNYLRDIPPALRGLHQYLIAWEKDNSDLLASTILLYKADVKKIYDKTAKDILQNMNVTAEDDKKDPVIMEALHQACLDSMPSQPAFFQLANKCAHRQPLFVSNEIVYVDL